MRKVVAALLGFFGILFGLATISLATEGEWGAVLTSVLISGGLVLWSRRLWTGTKGAQRDDRDRRPIAQSQQLRPNAPTSRKLHPNPMSTPSDIFPATEPGHKAGHGSDITRAQRPRPPVAGAPAAARTVAQPHFPSDGDWHIQPESMLRGEASAEKRPASAHFRRARLVRARELQVRRVGLTRKNTGIRARDLIFSVIDLETTGLDPGGIVEIGIVKLSGSGDIIDEFCTIVNTPGSSLEAELVHGVTEHDLPGAPSWPEVWSEVAEFIAGTVLVAHNLDFEELFLTHTTRGLECDLEPVPGLCTLETSRRQLDGRAFSLKSLHKTVSGGWRDGEHTALGDARAGADLLLWLLNSAPSELHLEGQPPAEALRDPRAHCLIKPRIPVADGTLIRELLESLPRTTRTRPVNEAASARYSRELTDALEDGRLTGEEARLLAAIAASTGLSRYQIFQLNETAWREAWGKVAEPSPTVSQQKLKTAEQLGLDEIASTVRGEIELAIPATQSDGVAHPRALRDWRIAFVMDGPETRTLRDWAVARGVRPAVNITQTVRFTISDSDYSRISANATPTMVKSSKRLGIEVVSPDVGRRRLEEAYDRAAAEFAANQAAWEKWQEERRTARLAADAYWRHRWRDQELADDPGPAAW